MYYPESDIIVAENSHLIEIIQQVDKFFYARQGNSFYAGTVADTLGIKLNDLQGILNLYKGKKVLSERQVRLCPKHREEIDPVRDDLFHCPTCGKNYQDKHCEKMLLYTAHRIERKPEVLTPSINQASSTSTNIKKLFISYAHDDKPLVKEWIVNILRLGGYDVWFDEQLIAGQDWKQQLSNNIQRCDALIYCMTPESIASEWCQWELKKAVDLRKPIVPVLMQARTQLPEQMKQLQYIDFTDGPTGDAVARLMGGLLHLSINQIPPAPHNPQGTPTRVSEQAEHLNTQANNDHNVGNSPQSNERKVIKLSPNNTNLMPAIIIANLILITLLLFFSIWLLAELIGPNNNQAVLGALPIILAVWSIFNQKTVKATLQKKGLILPLFFFVLITGGLCFNLFILPKLKSTVISTETVPVLAITITPDMTDSPLIVMETKTTSFAIIETNVALVIEETPLNIPENMVFIANGDYLLKLLDGQERTISLSAFAIDISEVSQANFRTYITDKSPVLGADTERLSNGASANSNLPMTNVSYDEALAYCQAYGKSLPSAEQWQVAAGWNPTRQRMNEYPWDSENSSSVINIDNRIGSLVPVNTLSPNALGLYHMAGNAAEWVLRNENQLYYAIGGHYRSSLEEIRIGHIGMEFDTPLPDASSERIGFRCVWNENS